MDKFPSNHIVKIGIVVNDLEAAVKAYAKLFNIPEPEIHLPTTHVKVEGGREPGSIYRGQEVSGKCKTAMIPLEPIYIELIEALDEPSPWTEFKQKYGQGVHYMAFEAASGFSDVENLMAAQGMPIYHKTEKGKQRYGYFDTEDTLGITVEFKEID